MFNPAYGPQQIYILNSFFTARHFNDIPFMRNLLTEAWSNQSLALPTAQPRLVFDFQDYDDQGTWLPRSVEIRNATVEHVDFRDVGADNLTTLDYLGKGSFIRTRNSNLVLDSFNVRNISTLSNGSFLQILPSNNPSISILINNSHFENCSALTGGVISLNSSENLRIEASTFVDNFANNSGVIDALSQNASVVLHKVTASGNTAIFDNSFGLFSNFTQVLNITDSSFTQNFAKKGSSTIQISETSALLHNLVFTSNLANQQTHVLTISNSNISQAVNISSCTFESISFLDEPKKRINGSYIHLQAHNTNLSLSDS